MILVGFGFIHLAPSCMACDVFGGQWQVRRPSDMAGLPLLIALANHLHVPGDHR